MKDETSALRYYVPAAALAAALFLRWLLDPWLGNVWPATLLFGAVAAAVWYGGYKQAIAVAVLGFLATDYLFIPPRGTISVSGSDVLGLALYLVSCALIIA